MKGLVKNRPEKPTNNASFFTVVVAIVVLLIVTAVVMISGQFSFFPADPEKPQLSETAVPSKLKISGSTTIEPLSNLLFEAFAASHDNCRGVIQGGGSGAGVSSAGMGIVDIGSVSRDLREGEMLKYPDLQVHPIGYSAVVVILHGIEGNFTDKTELMKVFNDSDGRVSLVRNETGELSVNQSGTKFQVFQRAEESGTEATFAEYLGLGKNLDSYGAEARLGNEGVLTAVEVTPYSIGFADIGFAKRSQEVSVAGPEVWKDQNLKKDLARGSFSSGEKRLIRPLNYVTKGKPGPLEQAFIDFARSPEAVEYFRKCGFLSITEN